MKKFLSLIFAVVFFAFSFCACDSIADLPFLPHKPNETDGIITDAPTDALYTPAASDTTEPGCMPAPTADHQSAFDPSLIPAYSDEPYAVINDNFPFFKENEITAESFEYYSELDAAGRCGPAFASVGIDLMPTEDREGIGMIKPTGWHTIKYDCIEGKYLYNRCHLIGFQLTGENANKKNLITGTRYLNIKGMLPFEDMTADFVKETHIHVMYRVTPVFKGDNLVADGVLMEALSVEDKGEGICFCVFAYNVQPGISIDYATGESHLKEDEPEEHYETYVLNTHTKKFHRLNCKYASRIMEKYKKYYTGPREYLIQQGYEPCHSCNP